MTDEDILVKKRLSELIKKSESGSYYTFTNFLGLAEQSLFSEVVSEYGRVAYTAFGGADGSERVVLRFGSPDELGYEEEFPIKTLKIEPKSQKFADKLSHRDFLGSLMNLGIEREMMGDIVIIDNVGYLFAKEEITEYICSSLTKIKHTDVTVKLVEELPEGSLYHTEMRKIQLSSERLDAVIAKTFSLSRDDAQSLFKKRLVFVNGKCTESTSHTPKPCDVISVRGHGRLIYRGYDSTSKKGKLNVSVELYI